MKKKRKVKKQHKPLLLGGKAPQDILYKLLPDFLMEIAEKYFRLKVEGAENIPAKGAAIIAPNHSGVSGFDGMLLAHEIIKLRKRKPRVLTHHFWFLNKTTALPANRLGFIDATMENGVKALQEGHLVVLFPEGEYGNFKPSSKAYTLQEFKRGFVRMALKTGAPIVPTIVIGAEETHINLSQFKLTKFLRGFILPLPLNVIPLPSKWKIIFLPPIELPYTADAANDRDLVKEIAEDIQEKMQDMIRLELEKRESIFF